jgi:hypothetical protein
VFVIDCTTMGWDDPTGTPPTSTVLDDRRRMAGVVDIDRMVEPSRADRHDACWAERQ